MTTWQQQNPAYEVEQIPRAKPPRPKSGGYPPEPSADGYSPRPTSGGYPPQPSADGYSHRPTSGSYLPQTTPGGYPPQPQPTSGNYPPQTTGGYPPQPTTGGYSAQPTTSSYAPQPTPSGYPPQQIPGGYPAQQTPNAYPLIQPATGSFSPQPNIVQQPVHANQNLSTVSNTTVIIQQPGEQTKVVLRGSETWHSGLCDICDDCGLCCLGFFCPGLLACHVSIDANECCCAAAVCPIALRASVRERYHIKGDLCTDCMAMTFCQLFALCQIGREIKYRR